MCLYSPRLRGLSVPCTKTLVVATYSPRMRGLLAGSDFAKQVQGVFPPSAGVIGLDFRQLVSCCCIPPVCGGYRNRHLVRGCEKQYSPRVRGLSVTFAQPQGSGLVFPRMRGLSEQFEVSAPGRFVFPPHAGVIGHPHGYLLHSVSILPACGGYRLREAKTPPSQGYSPRVRGLSVTFWQLVKHFCVFPPHAGVIGKVGATPEFRRGIPPVCGGYRAGFPSVGQLLLYSPRMRGLSALPDPNGHP